MKRKLFVMLDMETISSAHNAAILSIGATTFGKFITMPDTEDTNNTFVEDCFYAKLDPNQPDYEPEAKLFHKSLSTLAWWTEQDAKVREEAFSGTATIFDELGLFNLWIKDLEKDNDAEVCLFSNGAVFDIPIIKYALSVYGLTPAWNFRNEYCYRTICNMFPDLFEVAKNQHTNEQKHDALADAVYQANILEDIFLGLQLRGNTLWLTKET